jgi:hypothetical protein
MAFRSRKRAELSQAIAASAERAERAAREQAEALARIEANVLESLAASQLEIARREADLAQVLELSSALCRQAIEISEANRAEHDAFLESIAEVVQPAIAAPSATVLGGVVIASPDGIDLGEIEASERSSSPMDEPARYKLQLPFH